MNYKILLLLGAVIVASGCISQGSDSIEDVSSNPEAYMGEEVILQGEVMEESNGNEVIGIDEQITDIVGEEVSDAYRSQKVIGNVNGQVDFTGCEVSEFASEVKVKGEIKSYERCDCEPQNISQKAEQDNVLVEEDRLEELATKNTFSRACESEQSLNEETITSRENGGGVLEEIEVQGCIPETREKHYYFSCQEIVKEYE